MSLITAQTVGFAWTRTPVAVFVAEMAFPVLVCVLVRRTLVGQRETPVVAVQRLTRPAAGAGTHVGPKTCEA